MKELKLQVLIDDSWKYVFCYNPTTGIITTDQRCQALPWHAKSYFERKYANHEFRTF